MIANRASATAIGAAGLRASHQTLDGGRIFRDPLALQIFAAVRAGVDDIPAFDQDQKPLRLFIAARSRFAEDALARAVEGGMRQLVVLGAGFDTFALRNPFADFGLRVFEVDHPATQALKRESIGRAGFEEPASTRFVAVDFERETLLPPLRAVGFDPGLPAFFMWLGVVPFLNQDAIAATLSAIGQLPGAQIVFDYIEPIENAPAERRAVLQQTADRVAARGEPIVSAFDPRKLHNLLEDCGFVAVEDLGLAEIGLRYFGLPPDRIPTGSGPHLLSAAKKALP